MFTKTSCPSFALASLAALALSSNSAHAQSFNLDGGAAASAPQVSYSAVAGQPGVWNELPALTAQFGLPLDDLSGTPTGVVATAIGFGDFMFDNSGTSGDDELLLDDLIDGVSSMVVTGLTPGMYQVFTYAWAPDVATFITSVAVTNSPDPPQNCGGVWPGSLQLGVTHALHRFTIDAANPDLEVIFGNSPTSFNGAQIVKLSAGGIGATYCSPAVANATGVPGELDATGSLMAASNDVTLNAQNLPPNSFGFFLTSMTQGFVVAPGGSRGNLCLGGSIGRYVGPGQVQNAGGSGSFSLALDLTMTPTPAGLVAVMGGETWNFTTWYRDVFGGLATSNFTNGVELTFQ